MSKEIYLSKEQFEKFQSNLQEMLHNDLSLNIKSKGKVSYLAARALGFKNHQSISFSNKGSDSGNSKTEFEQFCEWANRLLLVNGNNAITRKLIAERGVPLGFVKVVDFDAQSNISQSFGYLPDMDFESEDVDFSNKSLSEEFEIVAIDSPDDTILKFLKKN